MSYADELVKLEDDERQLKNQYLEYRSKTEKWEDENPGGAHLNLDLYGSEAKESLKWHIKTGVDERYHVIARLSIEEPELAKEYKDLLKAALSTKDKKTVKTIAAELEKRKRDAEKILQERVENFIAYLSKIEE